MWVQRKERRLNEQFVNGMDDGDDEMMADFIRKLITIRKTSEITNEQVLA